MVFFKRGTDVLFRATSMQRDKASAQRGGTDLYARVTDLIISELEKGRIPWRKRWGVLKDGRAEVARNYVSKRPYTGINSVLLGCGATYERPYYLTFKQAADLGGRIRKGAQGHLVVFWTVLTKEKEPGDRAETTGKEDTKAKTAGVPLLRHYYVFNVADVEGIPFGLPELKAPDLLDEVHRYNACDTVYAAYAGAPEIVHRDPARAYYSPLFDIVNMPRPTAFDCLEAYYLVLFHELIHSTGHRERLNREELTQSDGFGGERYAKEELTAEIGACYLARSCGLDLTDKRLLENSAAYLNHWLSHLRSDKTLIFRASGLSQKAVTYILEGVSQVAEPAGVAA